MCDYHYHDRNCRAGCVSAIMNATTMVYYSDGGKDLRRCIISEEDEFCLPLSFEEAKRDAIESGASTVGVWNKLFRERRATAVVSFSALAGAAEVEAAAAAAAAGESDDTGDELIRFIVSVVEDEETKGGAGFKFTAKIASRGGVEPGVEPDEDLTWAYCDECLPCLLSVAPGYAKNLVMSPDPMGGPGLCGSLEIEVVLVGIADHVAALL
jgi:hypothetical protein